MIILSIFVLYLNLITSTPARLVEPFWNSKEYDDGDFGIYPFQEYGSVQLTSPLLNIQAWNPVCEYGYTLLTLRGIAVPSLGPVILDGRGNLIWADDTWGEAANLRVQTYQGKEYLTFWAGDVFETYGKGKSYMLDSTYEIKFVVEPVGELQSDMHEFVITPEDTALLTIYHNITASFKGVPNATVDEGHITDSIFQEINIATGELIFEWRASDHFSVADSLTPPKGSGESPKDPFDFFHINSIAKDTAGDYWISSRYLSAILCISKADGSVLHTLGGKKNDFTDLSEGSATNFTGQHHVTLYLDEEYSIFTPRDGSIYITVFDNGLYDIHDIKTKQSRAILIRLNLSEPSKPTAEIVQSYINPMTVLALSQGSVQVIPPISTFEEVLSKPDTENDDPGATLLTAGLDSILTMTANETVFVGWGLSAGYTEFDGPTGRVLCDVHFSSYDSFNLGIAKSYRVFKHMNPWIGKPNTRPSIGMSKADKRSTDLRNTIVYASWNGATEVKGWSLQGSSTFPGAMNDAGEFGWSDVATSPKRGFESSFNLDNYLGKNQSYNYYRVLALSELDSHSNQKRAPALGVSPTLFISNATVLVPIMDSKNNTKIQTLTDSNNTVRDYAIWPAIQPRHKIDKALQQALDFRVHNSGGPIWAFLLLGTLTIIGILVGWSDWIKEKIDKRRARSSSRTEDLDQTNAIPLLTMNGVSHNDSDDEDYHDDNNERFRDESRKNLLNSARKAKET